MEKLIEDVKQESFRPLTGILFFNWKSNIKSLEVHRLAVSVPLRGFCFSTKANILAFVNRYWFPSPYGDFVFQP